MKATPLKLVFISQWKTPCLLISVCLDSNAAFDTVDHRLFLSRLGKGFSGFSWQPSYLCNWSEQASIGAVWPGPSLFSVCVPQGSILSSLLFAIILPISRIANHFGT